MSSERTDAREQATAARARSLEVRNRAVELRKEAHFLTRTVIATMRKFDGEPVGANGDAFALRLPRLPVSLQFMRRELLRWLEHRGIPRDEAAEITLAVSEACANAMEHPVDARRQAIEVSAHVCPPEIEIVVRDFGRWTSGRTTIERGRGLEMIRALMDEVTIDNGKPGTCVVMRRRLRARVDQRRSAEIDTST
jgi:anti-sigma regulatory factor (Ser/Thr protein kinase)